MKIENREKARKGKKETEELMKRMKEKFVDFHVEHTNNRVIYDEKCEVCLGFWR